MDVLPFNDFQLGRNSVIEDFVTVNNGVDIHPGANRSKHDHVAFFEAFVLVDFALQQ